MRMTPIREKIIAFLAAQRLPVSLESVMQTPDIAGTCDVATAYRTLMLLRELEVIRPISLPHKVSYFVLNIPRESSHYLVCRCCGAVRELPVSTTFAALEQEVARAQDFTRLNHELMVFGIPRGSSAPKSSHG